MSSQESLRASLERPQRLSIGRSAQGDRVAEELEQLRQKQLAKNQRDKLNDLTCAPLTTPEEAEAFLAAMRDKSQQRERRFQPPSNLSSDGMDAWFLQQRQKEKELKERRREAEAILRNYRGSSIGTYMTTPTNDFTDRESDAFISPPLIDTEKSMTPSTYPFDQSEEYARSGVSSEEEEKKESHEPALSEKFPNSGRPSNVMQLPAEMVIEETVWRDFVSSKPGSKFSPEGGRYHLYCSYACPGSHRVLIVRALKGLEHAISVSYLHPVWRLTNPENPTDKHRGWVFGDPAGDPFANTINKGGPFPAAYPGNLPDPNIGAFSIREVYEFAKDTSGKFTIPLLWDTKLNTIVNNESSDIAYMLNSSFNDFAENPGVDLYTEDNDLGKEKLSEISEWMSPLMIHGVYRCGFAKSQYAYDRAINDLCAAFDRADDILEQQRYLTGDFITDADVRLFCTLLRFDEVYTVYFKANARLVMLTPSLLNFCRDIYQMPGVADTCNMEQIKAHFFASHAEWNKYSVIPRGLGFMELLDMPHDRETKCFGEVDSWSPCG